MTMRTFCQSSLPEVFEQGTVSEQLKYLEERTRLYENYRAIREDMFRVIKRNTLDSLANAKSRINHLVLQVNRLDNRIDSLQKSLQATDARLQQATRTKNSISVLGLVVNKVTYNTVMWTFLVALLFLLGVGYLTFKQNRAVMLKTRKDLNELKEEFEEYRTKSRLERERMAIEHFNEIKKLKGKQPNQTIVK
jgi:uncharacterized protein HemX